MNLKDKRILVMGLGVSGIATIKELYKLGAKISIIDKKNEEDLKDILEDIKDIPLESYLGRESLDLENIDMIIKSPGIPPNDNLLIKAREKNIDIINDIELGSNLSLSKNIIAITGTNGKTTTTTLVGEIFKKANYNVSVGGNIGRSIIKEMIESKEEDVFVLETSSFQLEDIINFKAKISLILNITPDHLDWHGSFENYKNSKKKIFKNQDKNDYVILNYDDEIVRNFEKEINSKVVFFSVNHVLSSGVFIEDGNILIKLQGESIKLLSIDKLLLKGKHNLENILSAVAIAYIMGLHLEDIRDAILDFKGVEHRLEYVKEKNGVSFYNDSKGTNIDSTIKAIEAIEAPIILIAGGYDKKIEFDKLILSFNGKVKSLILLGATALTIKEAASKYAFNDSYLVDSMEEAVKLSYSLSIQGDNILLSPACASWGMFKNFEERGRVFKHIVDGLGEK